VDWEPDLEGEDDRGWKVTKQQALDYSYTGVMLRRSRIAWDLRKVATI